VIGFDETNGWIYFDGKREGPHNKMIYRVKLDGSELTLLISNPGWYSAKFSPDFSHAVITYNNAQLPDQIYIIDATGKTTASLLVNDLPAFQTTNITWPEFMEIKTSDNNTELSCYLIKPHDFDATKKYPVITYGYSGPNHQVVTNQWMRIRNLWHSYMTSLGFIVFCVDGRGMSGRGCDFKHYAYGDISNWMIHDQIEGAKYLASLPFIDSSRIGFWGWSGGGYMACMLSTRASQYFSTCVAIASCTDFALYDTIWTERFMGLLSENKKGYDAANVLTYTKEMNSNLMLIHGTGDDNVHPQHTLKFVEALVQANKQFDLMLYPNRTHGIAGGNTSLHLYTKMTNFFINHLKPSTI
jgi:dipeptidyl-peptidase-4